MATCPECGTSSRTTPGSIKVEEVVVPKPLGSFSLAGVQMKCSANFSLRMMCVVCGWFVLGEIRDGYFYAKEG